MFRIEKIPIKRNYYFLLINFLSYEIGLDFQYCHKDFIKGKIKARVIRVKGSTFFSCYMKIKKKCLEIRKFLDDFNTNYSCFIRNYKVI